MSKSGKVELTLREAYLAWLAFACATDGTVLSDDELRESEAVRHRLQTLIAQLRQA
jgi:hypothetical protein